MRTTVDVTNLSLYVLYSLSEALHDDVDEGEPNAIAALKTVKRVIDEREHSVPVRFDPEGKNFADWELLPMGWCDLLPYLTGGSLQPVIWKPQELKRSRGNCVSGDLP